MKTTSWSIVLLLLPSICFSQQNLDVTNINAERKGEKLHIFFNLPDSKSKQTIEINIFAAINGGENREIRSVSGDVGTGIMGGKSRYRIIWDVFEDTDLLESVEFAISAMTQKNIKPSRSTTPDIEVSRLLALELSLSFSTQGSDYALYGGFGLRYARYRDWGWYLMASYGNMGRVLAGAVKNLSYSEKFRLNAYLGAGFAIYNQSSNDIFTDSASLNVSPSFELGLITDIAGFALITGIAADPLRKEETMLLTGGIAVRF